MPPSPITQRQLARELGLSQAAVSFALRNHPRISEAQCKAVQLAAQQMGYVYNSSAVMLNHFKRTSKERPICAALAWLNLWSEPSKMYDHQEFAGYRSGARGCAEKFGYHLEEFNLVDTPPAKLEKILVARGISGVILSPSNTTPEFEDFNWSRFSAIRLGRTSKTPQTDFVTADQLGNALLAFDSIRARGYKRIGWIHFKGFLHFRAHLHDAGALLAQWEMASKEKLPILALNTGNPGSQKRVLKRWIEKHKPDAVFSDHHRITELLQEHGYRVPGDIAVAGTSIQDTDASAGIYQRPEEIGRTAALMLLSQISDNAKGIPAYVRQLLIPGMWVDGPTLPRLAS